jgi:hypothetical protein
MELRNRHGEIQRIAPSDDGVGDDYRHSANDAAAAQRRTPL